MLISHEQSLHSINDLPPILRQYLLLVPPAQNYFRQPLLDVVNSEQIMLGHTKDLSGKHCFCDEIVDEGVRLLSMLTSDTCALRGESSSSEADAAINER